MKRRSRPGSKSQPFDAARMRDAAIAAARASKAVLEHPQFKDMRAAMRDAGVLPSQSDLEEKQERLVVALELLALSMAFTSDLASAQQGPGPKTRRTRIHEARNALALQPANDVLKRGA